MTKKQEKRKRQKAMKTEDQKVEDFKKKQRGTYNTYLRLAHASYIRVPEDYYESWRGIWSPPEVGVLFDSDHKYLHLKEAEDKD